MSADLKTCVRLYREQGLSFFPIPYKSKQSNMEWKAYQERLPNEAEISKWINGHDTNIAVVCGKVSGNLVVLDCDSKEKFAELAAVICRSIGIDDIRDFTRISQTSKGYHIWLRTKEPIKSQKFPQLDIKGEGGYVIAPPSVHPTGAVYHFINDKPIVHVDNLRLIGIDIEQKQDDQPRNQPGWVSQLLTGVAEGGRNDAAIKLAGYFRNTQPIDITERILMDWNTRNKPPLPANEIQGVLTSAYGYSPTPNGNNKSSINNCPDTAPPNSRRDKDVTETMTEEALSGQILSWIRESSGWFSYQDIDKEFDIRQGRDKDNRRHIIKRLKDAGTIEAHPKDNKLFRHVNVTVRIIDFKTATKRAPLAVRYPLAIEQYFNTYPGNIIALAGAADAGKTAWLLNFIRLNQFDFSIFYQSSEMGKEELASRLEKFEDITLDEWNFTAEERSRDFADVIRPDCINIVDYMELAGDFYNVADYMRQIHDKLGSGVCIIALQKKRGAELGRGGDFGLEKPRLYLSMDKGKLTIQKAKNWVDPENNPNGLTVKYKIVAGCKFIITQDWQHDESG